MEVLSCSDAQYVGESNCPQQGTGTNFLYNEENIEHGKHVEVSGTAHEVDDLLIKSEHGETDRPVEGKEPFPGNSHLKCAEEGKTLSSNLSLEKQSDEPCNASKISLSFDKIEAELPSSNRDEESCLGREGQASSCSLDVQNQSSKPSMEEGKGLLCSVDLEKQINGPCKDSKISLNVEMIKADLPSTDRDGESLLAGIGELSRCNLDLQKQSNDPFMLDVEKNEAKFPISTMEEGKSLSSSLYLEKQSNEPCNVSKISLTFDKIEPEFPSSNRDEESCLGWTGQASSGSLDVQNQSNTPSMEEGKGLCSLDLETQSIEPCKDSKISLNVEMIAADLPSNDRDGESLLAGIGKVSPCNSDLQKQSNDPFTFDVEKCEAKFPISSMEEGKALSCSLDSEKQSNEPYAASNILLNVENINAASPSSSKDGESCSPGTAKALLRSLDLQKQNNEPYSASKLLLNAEKIEAELPSINEDGKSRPSEDQWLEKDETSALWVKWRGKWQAGIRCPRADCPLSTLKARPTHDRKKYFVVFFPLTRNYSWADTLLVCPIHEFPEPIAHRTHSRGVAKVKDLSLPRRFIIQKLAISMLNVSDQLHTEAVVQSARQVTAWKEFAMEASRCKIYEDLGRILLKLQSMILQQYVDPLWLQNSFDSWTKSCQSAQSAASIETLKEEMVNSILWNDVEALWDAPVQPELGTEWKTWKQEAMKWFSTSHPMASGIDVQKRHSDSSPSISQQTSRKRAKLEVRRAELHASQMETVTSQHEASPQNNIVETETGFLNRQGIGHPAASFNPCNSKLSTERAAPSESPSSVTDRWDGIVVEVDNPGLNQAAEVEESPGSEGIFRKPLDPSNKYRQCMAFIEAKGRQCVRWANGDDVYCCVHLANHSNGKIGNVEFAPPADSPMCEGTTTHGTKCKHRSRYGSSFCKKHGLHSSQPLVHMEKPSSSPGNALKRKHVEMIPSTGNAFGKEIVLFQEGQVQVQEGTLSLMEVDNLDGRNLEDLANGNSSDSLYCIGLFNENNDAPCPDRAKLHSLYCEKHLPSWLKRARNGKSRIISKEIFTDLLRNCSSQAQKLNLHQACELLYRFIKSILSRRNPVSKETQTQWIISEASKNLGVGECLMKLVCLEREKLQMLWGFDIEKDQRITHTSGEQLVLMPPLVPQSSDATQIGFVCKICTEGFPDDQVLGSHFMDVHKKEAEWMFRGYACAICMESFSNKKVLETHVRDRHEMQYLEQCILFQCIPCGSHFMNPEQLWSHVLSVHQDDLKLSNISGEHYVSADQISTQLELGSNNTSERNSESTGAGRFICRLCGLKFDLLPDLGRHHQAAHMNPNSVNHISAERGTHVNPNRLKSGKLNHPSFTKHLGAASYRIRNRSNLRIKKRFQASNSVGTRGLRIQTQAAEEAGLGRLVESQCSSVAKLLFSEIQKTKARPSNLDILSVARSTCCKISLQSALEEQFGVLPERLYLKAAKLCSELNIQVQWHKEGFICPKGCKPVTEPHTLSPLMPLPDDSMKLSQEKTADPMDCEEWEVDECHYILESRHIKSKPIPILLCEDISSGRESVPISCVVDEDAIGSICSFADGKSNGKVTDFPVPWEGFTYVTERLLDSSIGLEIKSSQLGCACPHLTCSPEACDHVYLFDNDYENAEDIDGHPMHGRFPYDERGRIILKEGYLVYECNSLCSCKKNCRNRVLQNGVQVKLEVFKTENKGWAVRAAEAILRGTFVCEYIGEILDDQEANRGLRNGNKDCNYIYDIDTHNDDMGELTEGVVSYVIDATRYGNVSRFINHSCSPNLVSYLVLVESMDCQLAHVGLYASHDIAKGEELAFDYRHKLQPGEGQPCYCGSPSCRGLY